MVKWTQEDIDKLVDLKGKGFTYNEIGKVLGRTYGSVRGKFFAINNKEAIKEYKKKYYEDNKEIIIEHQKKYYEDNKETIREYHKKYNEDNKEAIKEYHKKYYEDNKEAIKEYKKKYYEDNKEAAKMYYYYRYQKRINDLIKKGYNIDLIDNVAPQHHVRVLETNGKYLNYLIYDKPVSDYSNKNNAHHLHHIVPYSLCMRFGDVDMACDAVNNRLILTYDEHQELHSILNENGLNPRNTSETDYDVYIKITKEWLNGYYDKIGQTTLNNY